MIKALDPQGNSCKVNATEKAFDVIFAPLGYKRASAGKSESKAVDDNGGKQPAAPQDDPAETLRTRLVDEFGLKAEDLKELDVDALAELLKTAEANKAGGS